MRAKKVALILGSTLVVGAAGLFAVGWHSSGMNYLPVYLRNTDGASAIGCWRLYDADWRPANRNDALWFAPAIAKLDSAVDTAAYVKTGREFRAHRLDSAGAPMDTGRRDRRRSGSWGRTAVAGKLWLAFQSGFGGPSFRFSWPTAQTDTVHGRVGEFSDTEPLFSHEGRAHAVREPCPQ